MPLALTIVAIAAVAVLLYYETRRPMERRYPKMVASSAFIGVAIAAGALDSAFGTIMLAGLALSWFGDLFLALDGRGPFVAGLVAFLLGHLAYVAAFSYRGLADDLLIPTLAVTVVALVIAAWLLPTVPGELRVPVIAYIAVISAMVALAVSTNALSPDWRLPTGAVAFFVSDIFVARDRFASPGFINRILGLPLYYGGQLLLAWAAGG
ncbi:MAG: lysoplasmalogenase [Acidimicrobiia bacterium]|nr:lysoplasmalogenase [Acidimicrobiia bacterium]